MSGLFTKNIKNKFVEVFKESIGNTSSNYYVSFGKFFNWNDDAHPPNPNSSVQTSFIDVNREMIFGKKVSANDIVYIGKRITWTSGQIYTAYDHTDADLFNKNFYVINNLGRVYKCLFNNNNSPSTVEPTLTVSQGDFNTADGYKWKYLYTISAADNNKFGTDIYFPIVPSATVTSAAIPGAIHVIKVDNSGNDYITANGSIDLALNTRIFKISNSGAISISGAYTNSYFYISKGSASGALTKVSDYVVNTSGKFVFTERAINGTDSTSSYMMGPSVNIVGDGRSATAITNVNANGSIESVRVIGKGRNYTYATISIGANTFFGYGANAHAIISPKGGHGSDIPSELGCDILGMAVSTSTIDNFPQWAKYRQVALIYNPRASANLANYQNTTFNQMLNFGVLNAPRLLSEGEVVQGFNSRATATVAYMNTSSIYVIGDTGNFVPYETLTSLSSGKTVVISTINNKDLIPYTSEVLYFKNIEPINRTGIRSENVKLFFNF